MSQKSFLPPKVVFLDFNPENRRREAQREGVWEMFGSTDCLLHIMVMTQHGTYNIPGVKLVAQLWVVYPD